MKRPKWLQFLTIQDGEQTHKVVLHEKEQPPKKGKFIVYCIGQEEQENTYKIRRGRRIVDTLNIREKKENIPEWVGVAEWREMGNVFYIETTCRTFEGGFLVLNELSENMRWSTLPERWTWSQPNYSELISEAKQKRPSFFKRIFSKALV